MPISAHTCKECGDVFKTRHRLRSHLAREHNIGNIHRCELCPYFSTRKADLTRHLSQRHDIDVEWVYCKHPTCQKPFKDQSDLNKHMRLVHGVNPQFFHCPHDKCDYFAKQRCHLKDHLANVHDIGPNRCDYCWEDRTSSNVHMDAQQGEVRICKECYRLATGKNSRKEHEWSAYIDKRLGTHFLTSTDRSLVSQGGCSSYRPDKMWIGDVMVIIAECDENSHGGKHYSCEQARLSKIYEEEGICGKYMPVIRWNPDSYTPPLGTPACDQAERLRLFVYLWRKIVAHTPPGPGMFVFYMFYRRGSQNIVNDIPHAFMDSKADIDSFFTGSTTLRAAESARGETIPCVST